MDSLQRLIDADAVTRLADRDPLLFSNDVDLRQPIKQRLGWTDLAEKGAGRLPLVEGLAAAVLEEGATDVVLLGMGGSSLTALVMSEIIGSADGAPRLHVLDSTSPSMVLRLKQDLDPASTYFLVASKSGTTIEPLSLYAIFREWMETVFERVEAGKHFIAITDPGTPLDKMRQKEFMRVALSAPPTVGGRFSALSIFGLAPAALMGIDVSALLGHAQEMELSCHAPAADNPGALLAAWISDAYEAGRDKLTLVTSARYRSFGVWVEQLVAESTGKSGLGVVPVIEYSAHVPVSYGNDRAVVVMRAPDDEELARFARLVEPDYPLMELTVEDPLAIGAEFVRWEFAVALLGHLLGINPFDEPNVAEAKAVTGEVLEGTADVPVAIADLDGVWVTYAGGFAGAAAPASLTEALAPLIAASRTGDYFALLAYVPYERDYAEPLESAATRLSASTRLATCLEMGPRYLHSTGQLHKGGRDTGVFLMITTRERGNVAIPGREFSLAQLYRAQAEGDLLTLAHHGRRVMRIDLPGDDIEVLGEISRVIGSLV